MTTTTRTRRDVTLDVRHDGIRAHALVIVDGRAAHLDDILAAAIQDDRDPDGLAQEYRAILAAIAPRLHLHVTRERDGSPGNGCCWYAVELEGGVNGDTLTTRPHRLTRHEFRGWNPTDEQVRGETAAILRRAVAIGLGSAQYWRGEKRTVAEQVS